MVMRMAMAMAMMTVMVMSDGGRDDGDGSTHTSVLLYELIDHLETNSWRKIFCFSCAINDVHRKKIVIEHYPFHRTY